MPHNLEQYVNSFSKMIQCETVSVSGDVNPQKFKPFHKLLGKLFPKLFAVLEVEEFNGSLLMKWKGKDSQNPVLLMSHHDVVEATGQWLHEPFSADEADGKIWGRGTLDTKNTLWAMLQAADELAEEGFVPQNDIWFESACTEETDGSGADAITTELQKRGINFSLVIDEGGYILHDPIGGADHDFAVIGVGEKGCADLKFVAESGGGHASMPGKNTPLVRLGKFMNKVERSKIFDVKMNDVTAELFYRCSPYMKGFMKFLFRNVRLLKPLLVKILPGVSNAAGAMLRTTIAFTMAGGSEGRNVLPQQAWVIGNMRFSHHQGKEKSIEAVKKIAARYDIKTEVLDPGFTSDISDYKSDEFKKIECIVKEVFPEAVPVPYIMTGASDCRYFSRVSKNCFRFAPFKISDEQLASIHGINENVDICCLPKAVEFYREVIKRA